MYVLFMNNFQGGAVFLNKNCTYYETHSNVIFHSNATKTTRAYRVY